MNTDIRKVNDIYVTECITFPRSGHTWLTRILKYYFWNDLNYCEFYTDPDNIIDLNKNTNFQKNHDFNLDTIIKNDRKYIIQIRNEEECLNSWFKFEYFNMDNNYDIVENNIKMKNENFFNAMSWLENKKLYYKNFTKKWIHSYIPNSKIIIYDHLKKNTIDNTISIIEFISDKKVDIDKINHAIKLSNEYHDEPFKTWINYEI